MAKKEEKKPEKEHAAENEINVKFIRDLLALLLGSGVDIAATTELAPKANQLIKDLIIFFKEDKYMKEFLKTAQAERLLWDNVAENAVITALILFFTSILVNHLEKTEDKKITKIFVGLFAFAPITIGVVTRIGNRFSAEILALMNQHRETFIPPEVTFDSFNWIIPIAVGLIWLGGYSAILKKKKVNESDQSKS